jgi:hypothetical protein
MFGLSIKLKNILSVDWAKRMVMDVNRRDIIFLLVSIGAVWMVYAPLRDLFANAARSEYYSHIVLIPLVSGFFLYTFGFGVRLAYVHLRFRSIGLKSCKLTKISDWMFIFNARSLAFLQTHIKMFFFNLEQNGPSTFIQASL